ncbi:MAG: hypothetical protein ACREV1_05320 [Gammaproteobacteria bacterium]
MVDCSDDGHGEWPFSGLVGHPDIVGRPVPVARHPRRLPGHGLLPAFSAEQPSPATD